ncbi:tRNA (adenosine(37)-N6)-threonylcarbamoyltransferase complex dimerization subunit type 1 TsaB [Desulfallas thermosapovorans]|uniref:tRNA threonylcarbamoyladenosine biosynthesis protein TsaB n=1 Tax=Desulfallas thermosapovorans DSM 6562 TaxID=1121431 RepID=A0A5S4ZTA7_9FIRM|nr:tRNA (adenosine(37)-N6)-threonylcarbamoyltransferase complex dimerization subunit type 1 TsaB [Desulfallas thermosapovorans]TYO96192.1 tRNA threonylcarbamoyladenosine biosynthesis protein TsaB [Desulfallas thermosapovorans DSM 6562]
MFVLGIETATPVASVAVVTIGKVMAERTVNNQRTHSVNLLPMIRDTLADAGINKEQLTGIAVSSGPGSFTGLRIGMSTARTLAQVLRLPLVGVPTLDALSYPLSGLAGLVCPILNARKNEVYTALYHHNGIEQNCLIPARAAGIPQLLELLASYTEQVTFIGDGVAEYGDSLKAQMGKRARLAPNCATFPRGAAVAELGLVLMQEGATSDPLTLLPQYVRESEAEIKWRERCLTGECKRN